MRRSSGTGGFIVLWMVVASLAVPSLSFGILPASGGDTQSISATGHVGSGLAAGSASSPNVGLGNVIATIPVGSSPQGDAFDSANGYIFVANQGTNNLSVINGATNRVVGNVPLPNGSGGVAGPSDLVVDNSNGYVYVADEFGFEMSVINGANNANVTAVAVPPQTSSPSGIALDTNTGNLFVPMLDDWNVTTFNTTSYAFVGSVTTGSPFLYSPVAACFDPTNGYVYVDQWNASGPQLPSNVVVVDGTTGAIVTTIATGSENGGCAYDNANKDIYVSGESGQNVTVINGATNTVLTTIHLGLGLTPVSVTYDAANGYLYTANQNDNVSVIDGTTNTVLGSITVGTAAYTMDVAVDSTNGQLYVTDAGNTALGRVSVINLSAGTTGAPVISSFTASPSMIPLAGATYLNVTAIAGIPPYAYSYTRLPAGCTTANTSSLPCKPTSAGTYSPLAIVTDSAGESSSAAQTTFTVGSAGTPGALTSVSISSTSSSVQVKASARFSVTLTCTGGSGCPSGASYAWSLTNSHLGALNSTITASVTFTAGARTGSLTIFVNTTLNGVTKEASSAITISTQSSSSGGTKGFLGLPGDEGYLVIGAILVVVAAAAALLMRKKPYPPGGPPPSYPTHPDPPQQYPPPPPPPQ
ncbi:MAG: hypothetical protein ACYDFT_08095 [Thermoplasmata archaeon]